MPRLLELPKEVLLDVASFTGKRGLYNLSLTCRELGPIAQEALHRHPTLLEYQTDRVDYLVRTLLTRPDLASKVRVLDIPASISSHARYHAHDCLLIPNFSLETTCSCGHTEKLENIRQAIWPSYPKKVLDGRPVSSVCGGSLILGFIIILSTKLEHLRLRDGFVEESQEYVSSVNTFGVSNNEDLSRIPGMKSLRSLYTQVHLNWRLENLPKLQELTMRYYPRVNTYPLDARLTMASMAPQALTTLNIHSKYYILWAGGKFRTFLKRLAQQLTALHTLQTWICGEFDEFEEVWRGQGYENILNALQSTHATLQSLVIDDRPFKRDAIFQNLDNKYLSKLGACTTLHKFTNLRRLVVPHQAIYHQPSTRGTVASIKDMKPELNPTISLPATIETLEILCPHSGGMQVEVYAAWLMMAKEEQRLKGLEKLVLHSRELPDNFFSVKEKLNLVGVEVSWDRGYYPFHPSPGWRSERLAWCLMEFLQ
ncbi:hypothetical protein CC80DRAFT_536858 [Byssothecium circinans]|uniref:F-box domain-containing protein n=1 Tax=Byssothecium circinans TaxID=147558 RepID=A0A6A5TQU0_9PLEO|nr:hypothetical protein CC80DRAFT_536858 [Byssothecium circinans]